MSILVKSAEEQITAAVSAAIEKAVADGAFAAVEIPAFKVEIPADKANGDYSANAAFMLSKALRMPPRKIAEEIEARLSLEGSYFERAQTAGAGFLNFFLGSLFYADILLDIAAKGENYGHSDMGAGKSALVEFVSANPTGPMHVGNARGGALGDCLASVLSWAGYRTEREFYVNDSGNQIEKFALSLDLRYLGLYLDGIEMPEDSYHGEDIIAHAKAFAAEHGDSLITSDEAARRKALVDFALPKNIAGLETDLLKYRIKYDTWFLESSLHKNGEVQKVLALLKDSGYTYELDGAVWFKATDFGCDKDFVLVRSNGLPTYIVPDIAYHYNKLCVRGFDRAIDILGADHHGYVPRLKGALEALGVDSSRLEVVLMQMVRLVKDGEVIKASKRSGKAITLVTLLEEVPIDAARFFFNFREANSHFDFDLDLAVENSSQNPVYYCQYAHARICSIFKKLAAEGVSPRSCTRDELCLLCAPEEKELVAHLAALTGEVELAAKTCDPTRITHYATELAGHFHKFYNAVHVMVEDEALMQARLFLCASVRDTMKNILTMLKVDSPEAM